MKQNTRERILRFSEHLLLSQGYNGFSFMDVAEKVGIKKASIHYHFPTKEDLAIAIVTKYRKLFSRWQDGLLNKKTVDKISSFFSMYHSLSRDGELICPMGMLAAEYPTLPGHLQEEVKVLLDEEREWLISCLNQGLKVQDIPSDINAVQYAELIMGYLSGAIKFWRIYDDVDTYYQTRDYLLDLLKMK